MIPGSSTCATARWTSDGTLQPHRREDLITKLVPAILSSLYFAFGGRMPYSRWSSAVLGFLRDVCEPYLGFFRRFIPSIGPLDISPIVAIFVLNIVSRVIHSIIAG